MKIENYTKNSFYEKVVSVGGNLLNIPKEVCIQIKQFPHKITTSLYHIGALAQPSPYNENIYELYMDSTIPDKEIGEIIAHELIHIEQMVNKRLKIQSDKESITWEGKKYLAIPYSSNFPWEQEAHKKMKPLWKEIQMRLG